MSAPASPASSTPVSTSSPTMSLTRPHMQRAHSALRRLQSPLAPLNTESPVPPTLKRRPLLSHRGSDFAQQQRIKPLPPSPSTDAAGCEDPVISQPMWLDNAEYSVPPPAPPHLSKSRSRISISQTQSANVARRARSAPAIPTLASSPPSSYTPSPYPTRELTYFPLSSNDVHLHHFALTSSAPSMYYGPASIMAQVARHSQQIPAQ